MGASYRRHLHSDLVFAPCLEVYVDYGEAVGVAGHRIGQSRQFGSGFGLGMGVALVGALDGGDIALDASRHRLRGGAGEGAVGFSIFPSRSISLRRDRALEVLAKITSPPTGRSRRCTTPQNTLPGLGVALLMYCLTVSTSGVSPVLSPCTISPGALSTTIMWLSSYIIFM